MNVFLPLALLALASVTTPSHASGFDCVAPEFPQRSSTNESVLRVQKQIKTWRACYAGQEAAGQASPDAQKLNAEVDAGIQKWVDATRAASARNAINTAVLSHIERERTSYLHSGHLR